MSVEKVIIKKLPKSEIYILSFKEVKKYFGEEHDVKLFMTNDVYTHDTLYKKKRPVIDGIVVFTATISNLSAIGYGESLYIHLYKAKNHDIDPKIKEKFISNKVPAIASWIERSKGQKNTKMHRTFIVSVKGIEIRTDKIEY